MLVKQVDSGLLLLATRALYSFTACSMLGRSHEESPTKTISLFYCASLAISYRYRSILYVIKAL